MTPVRVGVVLRQDVPRRALALVVDTSAGLACVGQAATLVELAAQLDSELDLVVLALLGPADDGPALVADARWQFGTARIVVLAEALADDTAHAVIEAGATAVLPTDSSISDLQDLLRGTHPEEVLRCADTGDARAIERAERHGLTRRERQVLEMVANGRSPEAVARSLGIGVHAVRHHLELLRWKLACTTTSQLIARADRLGLVAGLAHRRP